MEGQGIQSFLELLATAALNEGYKQGLIQGVTAGLSIGGAIGLAYMPFYNFVKNAFSKKQPTA